MKNLKNSDAYSTATVAAICCALGLLAQLPSGIMHVYLGKWTYFRDIFLVVSLAIGLASDWKGFRRLHLPFLEIYIGALTMICAWGMFRGARVTAVITFMWVVMWIAALFSGYRLMRTFGKRAIIIWLICVTAYGVVEIIVGRIEMNRGAYFLDITDSDVTAFGVQEGVSATLEDALRIRGLQRSVFSYANLMGTCTICAAMLAYYFRKRFFLMIGIMGTIPIFAIMLVLSGGRSAIFGDLFALIMCILGFAGITKRWLKPGVLVMVTWIVVGIMTAVGVGRLVSKITEYLSLNNYYMNVESSFDRDFVWNGLWQVICASPISFLVGVPFTNFDAEPIAIADNWLLWNFYHGGLLMAILFVAACVQLVTRATRGRSFGWAALIAFGFMAGEGLARDSFFFFSAPVFFMICAAAITENSNADHTKFPQNASKPALSKNIRQPKLNSPKVSTQ